MRVGVPLHQPPKVVAIAVATHGHLPVQRWRIPGLWSLHLYRYAGEIVVDGQVERIQFGHAGWTPPGEMVEYRFQGPSSHLYCHIEWPEHSGVDLPRVAPLGSAMPILWARLMEAAAWYSTDLVRTNVRVWDVALEIADLMAQSDQQVLPEPVRVTLARIEERLDEAISVAELARYVCISHNHLTRLFRQSLGKTVTQSIQERRVARARHLLERTDIPIKEIAYVVGLPDLQQFNKTVRKHLGVPPSTVRDRYRNAL
ncbi:MAG TPA: AraC family transcriptional regulator [Fimbriimonas sp.]